MKKLIFAAALASLGWAGLSAGASAMPIAPAAGAEAGLVQDIAYGCGRGYAPNRWGRCVRVDYVIRPAPVYRPAPYYRPGPVPTNRSGYGRVCPRGTHPGRQGNYCQPNY